MSTPNQRLIGYLLGELDDAERSAVDAELAADPQLRAELDSLRPVVSRLEALPDDAWHPVDPPPLELPEDADVAAPTGRAGRPSRRLSLRPAVAALCAVVLLLGGVGIGLAVDPGGDASSPPSATKEPRPLEPIGDADPSARGQVTVADGRDWHLRLRASGLRPNDPKHFYELWLLDPDGKMVALGSFRADDEGKIDVRVPLPVDPARYSYFDLSLQPDTGNPAHSGNSVLRGATRS